MSIDDDIRRAMEMQELLRRAADPLADARRAAGLDQSSVTQFLRQEEERRRLLSGIGAGHSPGAFDPLGIGTLAHRFEDHHKLLAGPIEDYRRFALLDPAMAASHGVITAIGAYDRYEHMFRRPEPGETARLAQEAITGSKLYGLNPALGSVESAMTAMRSPWLHSNHVLDSARGLTQLYAIGHAINSLPPFGESLSIALRGSLGDWRGVTMLPPNIFENPVARSDFYIGLGFDPDLTDFPAAAFDEGTALAGLRPMLEEEDEGVSDEERGLARSNAAHKKLVRFERRLRRFIDQVMTAEFGSGWENHRVPGVMFDAWKLKKAKAATTGEAEASTIAYAEFSDYLTIIESADNWNSVFERVFGRREDVKESFTRLFPVRNCTMHGRLITLDDEFYLLAETTRVLRAIERHS